MTHRFLTFALFTSMTSTAFAQTIDNPIEIEDCTVIQDVTEDTWYVVTKDLDCWVEDNLGEDAAAIVLRNNTGRILLDLNGRTLTGPEDAGDRRTVGVSVSGSPGAWVGGNHHRHPHAGVEQLQLHQGRTWRAGAHQLG